MGVYASYRKTAEYELRYGDVPWVLFVVTTTPTQRTKLMRATADIWGYNVPEQALYFAESWAAHPEEIGKNWHKIETVSPGKGSGDPVITTKQANFF
jgi:hypothetical protein